MTAPVGYGIDFGTSNSSISIAYDDGSVEVLAVGDSDMPHSLPSIAYFHRDGNRLAGEDAVNEYLITGSNRTLCDRCSLVVEDFDGRRYSDCLQYSPGGFCNDTRLMYALKSELANDMFRKTHSWAVDFEMPDLVEVILGDLKRRADRYTGYEVDRAVVGTPVAFIGAERGDFDTLQELAEKRLLESAYAAGFSDVELFYEPAAAILDQPLLPGITVALDFGGGTFDVAVIEMPETGGAAEVIGLQGAAVGGTEFDGLIFDYAVADQIGANEGLPAYVREHLRTLMGVRFLLSDRNLRVVLAALRAQDGDTAPLEELLYGGHAYSFYKTIEDAKIDLSSRTEVEIAFTRPGIRVDQRLTRAQFDGLIAPHMAAVERAIRNALEEAEVTPEEVHTAVRTGGSSEIPLFLDLVSSVLPSAKMRALPVFTAVAEGLGQEVLVRWGQ